MTHLCFDLFYTLADAAQTIPRIWEEVLGERHTPELAKQCDQLFFKGYMENFQTAMASQPPLTMEEVYLACCGYIGQAEDLGVSAQVAAHQVMRQHAFAPLYSEVLAQLEQFKDQYTIILCSDGCSEMVTELVANIPHDHLVLSQDVGCYKGVGDGAFFTALAQRLHVEPQNILHVGDTVADVVGAQVAGLQTCYLSRKQVPWEHAVQPTYQASDLQSLAQQLNTKG